MSRALVLRTRMKKSKRDKFRDLYLDKICTRAGEAFERFGVSIGELTESMVRINNSISIQMQEWDE